mmetsp:Transcript_30585/g.91406  ORF Transcript_30585/g.91406 Transcript_30585/m.91406 type:complete len:370 (+) Transcript_30585:2017-3126(+)
MDVNPGIRRKSMRSAISRRTRSADSCRRADLDSLDSSSSSEEEGFEPSSSSSWESASSSEDPSGESLSSSEEASDASSSSFDSFDDLFLPLGLPRLPAGAAPRRFPPASPSPALLPALAFALRDWTYSSLPYRSIFLLTPLINRFLTAAGVLLPFPLGSFLAILDQSSPTFSCIFSKIRSSSSVHFLAPAPEPPLRAERGLLFASASGPPTASSSSSSTAATTGLSISLNSSLPYRSTFLLKLPFHRPFTISAVLPGIVPAILAHLVPHLSCPSTTARSSPSVQASLRASGSSLFLHRSRHLVGSRPGRNDATTSQRTVPRSPSFGCCVSFPASEEEEAAEGGGAPTWRTYCSRTSLVKVASSSSVHSL